MYKNVSRRREKKGRLRRDDCRDAAITVWGYRGVSGFYDPAIPLLHFLRRDDVGVSRRRVKKERLRRDARASYRGVTNGIPRSVLLIF